MNVLLYDTTLRDGAQQEGLQFSVEDKLQILRLLDDLRLDYIEGGWPGSNPTDAEFFDRAEHEALRNSKLVAFGATRRTATHVEDDPSLRALLHANTPAVAFFGKSAPLHVARVLATSLESNLHMIRETAALLAEAGREVIFDAEHFFDGFRESPEYALETLHAAVEGGASTIVLCDTNGGCLPHDVQRAFRRVRDQLHVRLGIHTHDDAGLAVANSLVAVQSGATHVQGTMNGYGERCGNADLCAVLPSLVLKMECACQAAPMLPLLSSFSATIDEVANCRPDRQRPYVGASAFAHKGGMHVDALTKCSRSYEHIDPKTVGNRTRTLVSGVSGRANLRVKAEELGLQLSHGAGERQEARLLGEIKQLEHMGFQFESAEASIELLIRRLDASYVPPFELADFHVLVQGHPEGGMRADASVKVSFDDQLVQTAADGNGPVNALDQAVRKALIPKYPQVEQVRLADYKVRILDAKSGTAARTRVLITSTDGTRQWSTVGCATNVIEASWLALADALEYALIPVPAAVASESRGEVSH